MKIKIFLPLVSMFFHLSIVGQTNNINSLYILSGTVVNGETNEPLIGAHLITNHHFGTKTDEIGAFSVSVQAMDTISISFVGYKTLFYIAPTKESGKYLIKFKLFTDSISLDEVEIFPWPNYEEFKKAFSDLKPKEPEIKMEGVKMYQDRSITPLEFSSLQLLSNPISFLYDKLLDEKAKQRRRIERYRETIQKSIYIND